MQTKLIPLIAALALAPAAAGEIVGYYPGWKHAAFPVTAANVDAGRLSMRCMPSSTCAGTAGMVMPIPR